MTVNWYYQDSIVKFAKMDCIKGMAELPENTANLIVTSPPYNVSKVYEEGVSFGDYLKLLSDFYTQGFRVIKKGGYAIVNFADYYIKFGGENPQVQPMTYLHHLIAEHAGWVHQNTRFWKKDFASLSDAYSANSNTPKQEIEYIMTCRKPGGGKEKVREQQYHPHQIWDTTGKRQTDKATLKLHPAAFPEHLVVIILSVYSDPGDTVIDPFLGSATTLLVAKKMGRKGIGFELSSEYCDTSMIRLSQQAINFDDKNGQIIMPMDEVPI